MRRGNLNRFWLLAKAFLAISVAVIISLGLSGCVGFLFTPEDFTLPPEAGNADTVQIAGRVDLPEGTPLAPSQLRVLSAFESAAVSDQGGFDIKGARTATQLIIFETPAGNIPLLGYVFFEGELGAESFSPELEKFIITPRAELAQPEVEGAIPTIIEFGPGSTALSLVMLSPLLITSTGDARVAFAEAVLRHSRFYSLVSLIENALLTDPQNVLNADLHPDIFATALQISLDIFQQEFASSSSHAESHIPPEHDIPQVGPYDRPWLEDVVNIRDINLVNPKAIYYAAGSYDHDSGEQIGDILLLDRRHWIWLQWPPGLGPDTKELYDLNGNRIDFEIDKGGGLLAPDRSLDNPVIREATIYNGLQGVINLADLFIPLVGIIDLKDLRTLATHFGDQDFNELAGIMDSVDWVSAAQQFIEWILKNNDKIINALIEIGVKGLENADWASAASQVLKEIGKLLVVLHVAKAPFFVDLITAPSSAYYEVEEPTVDKLTWIPTATADAIPTSGPAPLDVNFTGTGTDRDGVIGLYQWDFDGDGVYDWQSTSTGNTSHTYPAADTYQAIFKVTDNDGSWDTASVDITVSPGPIPTAEIYAGTSNPAAVYKYEGDTQWTSISSGSQLENEYAVLDLIEYNGHLYAGTVSWNGIGRLYKYEAGSWDLVCDNLDHQVSSLVEYAGNLYAGTSWAGGRLYRYDGPNQCQRVLDIQESSLNTWWGGFRSAYVWTDGWLYLGDIGMDYIGRFDGTTFSTVANLSGSCIYDFESYNGNLYASAWQGRLHESPDGLNWYPVLDYHDGNMWEIEVFQNYLYMGLDSGGLERYNGAMNETIWTAPDSIISMIADDDQLYIGTGGEAGYHGDTTGISRVYKYDGTGTPELISNTMGTGVQVLYMP